MRILYGVVGEGMGHAMRSRVVLEHLFARGHEVEIIASGRAAEFLHKRFSDRGEVHRIHGLHIVYDDNRVRRGSTLFSNVLDGTAAIPKQIAAYFELVSDFRPEVVISDFESWTYYYAKVHRLPIFSIDNMQILNRCRLDEDVLEGYRAEFEIAKAFVKGKLPFCDHYLVTTFFRPEIRKERTTLFPPILRPEILAAERRRGEHLLVYQTAEGHETLLETLAATGLECRVYGVRRNLESEVVEGNLRYRPFSEAGFIDDLASARGVIAGGGFTLMSECVYLHKPMLAVPVEGQFEQVLNARYLEKLGYGRFAETLDDPKTVLDFLEAIPGCEGALASYAQDGNREILEALDGHLASVGD
ncbi:MAG: MJ1255/VC2487 family glycosyltransferase [Polyangiales bacterium]